MQAGSNNPKVVSTQQTRTGLEVFLKTILGIVRAEKAEKGEKEASIGHGVWDSQTSLSNSDQGNI